MTKLGKGRRAQLALWARWSHCLHTHGADVAGEGGGALCMGAWERGPHVCLEVEGPLYLADKSHRQVMLSPSQET